MSDSSPTLSVLSTLPPIPRYLILLLLGVTLVASVRSVTRPDPLRNVPGPWLARWTTLLLAYHSRTGKRHLYVDGLHKIYGPLVRITPTQVSCATPSALGAIYAHGPAALPKSPFYRAFYVSGTPNLFSTQDRTGHARKRRALAHAFSAVSVRGYELWARNCLSGLVKGLDARCVGELGKGVGIGAETKGRAGGSDSVGMNQERVAGTTKRLDTEPEAKLPTCMSVSNTRTIIANTTSETRHSPIFGPNLHNRIRLIASTDYARGTRTDLGFISKRSTGTGITAGMTSKPNPTDPPFTDILAWLNYMTFDVISSLAFGKALGMLECEGNLADTSPDVNNALDSHFNAQGAPSLQTSKKEGKPTPIHTLIDYRGRTAAFLGLFPAWHSILHPLLHRYARWVPDEFIRRGVSGTETLSHVARRCVHQRLLPPAASQPIHRSSFSPGTIHVSPSHSNYLPYLNSHSVSPDSDPESLSDMITTTPSTFSDSESDSERTRDYTTGSAQSSHSAVDLENIDPDFITESTRQPDLLDRIIDGMRRAKRREASERRERGRGAINTEEFGEGHENGEGEDADGEDVREADVVTEAMLLLTAGSDTTANSTAAVLFYIIRTPRVLARLREELEVAVNSNPMEGDTEGMVWYDQIKSTKYLQASIDEGLRMFATNAFGLPRVVPPGGVVHVGGMAFGEGTELSVPAYTMQHDPAIWGDPEVFRPERWLEGSSVDDTKHSDAKINGWSGDGQPKGSELKKYLLTFGMGPRACIGKNLAAMQMQLLVATLVLRYDMELRDEVMESVEGFMHKPVAVWVRLRRRE